MFLQKLLVNMLKIPHSHDVVPLGGTPKSNFPLNFLRIWYLANRTWSSQVDSHPSSSRLTCGKINWPTANWQKELLYPTVSDIFPLRTNAFGAKVLAPSGGSCGHQQKTIKNIFALSIFSGRLIRLRPSSFLCPMTNKFWTKNNLLGGKDEGLSGQKISFLFNK